MDGAFFRDSSFSFFKPILPKDTCDYFPFQIDFLGSCVMAMTKKARASPSVDPSSPIKLVLSFHSKPPPVTESTLNEIWEASLRPAVRSILRGDHTSVAGRKEVLYREVERLVKLQFTKSLLEKVEMEINEFCVSVFPDSDFSIDAIENRFDSFVDSMDLIVRIFNALDRELRYMASSLRSTQISFPKDLMTLGFSVWRSHFCRPENDLSGQTVETLLSLIHEFRVNGSHFNTIKRGINMLLKIGIFHNLFEANYLQKTKEFYSHASNASLANTTSPPLASYVDFVNRAFEFERNFVADTGMPISTWKTEDLDILRVELVLNRIPQSIQTGLLSLIRSHDIGKLKSLYNVCLLNQEKLIVESIFRHSFQESIACICSEAGDEIEAIMKVRRDVKSVLTDSFDNRPSFLGAYKDAMETVLNSQERSSVPARLAEWTDRKMFALMEEESMKSMDWTDDLLGVFKLLSSKDLFEAHYRALLSKRLIFLSANFAVLSECINQETSLVNLLKQECGAGYTSKLEGMIRDVCVSQELAEGTAMQVTVATTGVWPLTPWTERVKLPQNIHDLEIHFMRKYIEKNEKKSIKFVHSMTSAIVRYKRRDYVCSAAQALVLNLLNDSEVIERSVVIADTGLPEPEVSKALLTLKEAGLLIEERPGFFSVNSAYKPPAGTGRIELNQYQYRRPEGEPGISEEERAQTEASAMEDRQHQVDAAIVRVMKKLRKCSPATLYSEILNSTKFAFSKQEITKRISALVDREFIEKDPGDDGEVRYLA